MVRLASDGVLDRDQFNNLDPGPTIRWIESGVAASCTAEQHRHCPVSRSGQGVRPEFDAFRRGRPVGRFGGSCIARFSGLRSVRSAMTPFARAPSKSGPTGGRDNAGARGSGGGGSASPIFLPDCLPAGRAFLRRRASVDCFLELILRVKELGDRSRAGRRHRRRVLAGGRERLHRLRRPALHHRQRTGYAPVSPRGSVAWAFTTPYANNWHPLTWLSHMVDVELFGLDAGGPSPA